MNIEKEREAFEAWYCGNHTGLKQSDLAKFRTPSGYFFSDPLKIDVSWEAWQAAKAQAVPEWISVKRGMPKAGSRVLTYDDYGFADVATIDGCEDPNNVYFSYWLLLPDAPIKAQEPTND